MTFYPRHFLFETTCLRCARIALKAILRCACFSDRVINFVHVAIYSHRLTTRFLTSSAQFILAILCFPTVLFGRSDQIARAALLQISHRSVTVSRK